MTPAFSALHDALKYAHETVPALREFVAFPGDLAEQRMDVMHRPCADYLRDDPVFSAADDPLARAFYDAGPDAQWLETYGETDIGDDFLTRFGCYCAIGGGGAWTSDLMAGYVVTMPPGLYYPWHQHPAEELYLVLAGEAEFYAEGQAAQTLRAGGTSFHASNQPHAMQTFDTPVMAYVTWRNHLSVKPVLTDRAVNGG
ncbi:MAG: dimethylsulfonioproprionate lyase family protein [Planktomarina sp.]